MSPAYFVTFGYVSYLNWHVIVHGGILLKVRKTVAKDFYIAHDGPKINRVTHD